MYCALDFFMYICNYMYIHMYMYVNVCNTSSVAVGMKPSPKLVRENFMAFQILLQK